ncbi:hypothetical protein MASR2M41_11330 [Flammeovirgaceae bacterium]
MQLRVTISERAEKNLKDIISYLEQEWSSRVSKKYLDILQHKVNLISKNHNLYEASQKKKSIFRCVLTKQSIMYYRVGKEEIEIITIQDSRRDLRQLKI